jgi:hypothetical protein
MSAKVVVVVVVVAVVVRGGMWISREEWTGGTAQDAHKQSRIKRITHQTKGIKHSHTPGVFWYPFFMRAFSTRIWRPSTSQPCMAARAASASSIFA